MLYREARKLLYKHLSELYSFYLIILLLFHKDWPRTPFVITFEEFLHVIQLAAAAIY